MTIAIGNVSVANAAPLALIAGLRALESRQHAFDMCWVPVEMAKGLGIGLIQMDMGRCDTSI